MSKMKSLLLLYGAAVATGSANMFGEGPQEYKESKEKREKRFRDAEVEGYKRKGLQEFRCRGGSVWALNQKSADKKAKKLGIDKGFTDENTTRE